MHLQLPLAHKEIDKNISKVFVRKVDIKFVGEKNMLGYPSVESVCEYLLRLYSSKMLLSIYCPDDVEIKMYNFDAFQSSCSVFEIVWFKFAIHDQVESCCKQCPASVLC